MFEAITIIWISIEIAIFTTAIFKALYNAESKILNSTNKRMGG